MDREDEKMIMEDNSYKNVFVEFPFCRPGNLDIHSMFHSIIVSFEDDRHCVVLSGIEY